MKTPRQGASSKARGRRPLPPTGIVASYLRPEHAAKEVAALHDAPAAIQAVQSGLPFDELEALREALGLPLDRLAPKLGMSRATLHRRRQEGRLTPMESDRLMRYARLMGAAMEVFHDETTAREWLQRPQFGLGRAVPLDYAESEMGAREVENLLWRVAYGVYS